MNKKDWTTWYNHDRLLSDRSDPIIDTPKRIYHFILNCFTNQIEYTSDAIENILAYNAKTFTIEQLIANIHPEDLDYCLACEMKMIEFMDKIYHEDHYRFYSKYTYRVKKASGEYICIKQSYQAIEINEFGHMSKSLVTHEIAAEDHVKGLHDFQIIDRIKSRPTDIKNIYDLSKREIEILDLIMNGMSSQEIADQIFISKHTVNTHRKNILHKTNTANFSELRHKLTTI